MGFFYTPNKGDGKKSSGRSKVIPVQALNSAGCSACPLDKADLEHPKMEPVGSERPIIYVLGEVPSETDDQDGEPFAGKSGKMIRASLEASISKRVRYNNVLRCRSDETPQVRELECCRRFIEKDIEDTKPIVIVGAGGVPLTWATGLTNIQKWRGRFIPVKIGNHICWYYPILHPTFVMRKQSKHFKNEWDITFEKDLENLMAWLDTDIEDPEYFESGFADGLTIIEGGSASDLELLRVELDSLALEPDVAIDWETTALRPYAEKAQILMVSVGTFERTVAFPLDHPDGWNSTNRRKAWELLTDFIANSGKKIAHNLSFELEWTAEFFDPSLLRKTEWEDTMAMEHTIDERPGVHNLGVCTRKYFGFNLKEKSVVDPVRILEYPLKTALIYNGMDSKWTHRLFHKLKPVIYSSPEYTREYERKVRTCPTLVLSQAKGVVVDDAFAATLKDDLEGQLKKVERQIGRCPEIDQYSRRFGSFNPTSPEHVVKLLRDVLKRTEGEKKEGDKVIGYSSDEEVLSAIPKEDVPSAPLILELRGIAKLLSTYVIPITEKQIVYPDGKMHTNYNSMVAVTGRLSSDAPNLQNFPKRKHKHVRGVVVAPPGEFMISADYGQIEARVIGMASEDENLTKYLWTGYDVHAAWAKHFREAYEPILDIIDKEFELGGDEKKIMKTLRQEAKNKWVFPQFFGSSPFSCARNMKVPDEVAKKLADFFWDEFKGVKKWQDKLIKKYEKVLYVETLTGRRRRGPMSKNEIINSPIQGTAADIVLDAMNRLSEYAQNSGKDQFQPIMNIHDDLTFYMPEESVEDDVELLARMMCTPTFDFINCPIVVEVSAGFSWNDQDEIGVYQSDKMGLSTKPRNL